MGSLGYSLIPEENVEEINLNYKDEASLESGFWKGYRGTGRRGNRHFPLLFFILVSIFRLFFPLFFDFFPLILWE